MGKFRTSIGWRVGLAGAVALLAGCQNVDWNAQWNWNKPKPPQAGDGPKVPEPVSLLLPKEIRIHPFSGTRTFDEAGGAKGIEVRIEALDAYGDNTKAFGDFAFELHTYRPNNLDPKSRLVTTWREPLLDANRNLRHWDSITKTYLFRLQWYNAAPAGQRFVLVAVFTSPFTERLFAERVFISAD